MTLDLQVVFNDILDRIEITDNSVYPNNDAKGVISLVNPLGGVVIAPGDLDLSPQIDLPVTGNIQHSPIPRFTDTNNILTGEYVLDYDYKYTGVVELPVVLVVAGSAGLGNYEVSGNFIPTGGPGSSIDLITFGSPAPRTIISAEYIPELDRTRIFVSEGVTLIVPGATASLSYEATIIASEQKKFTINAVALAAPCITSVISCFSGKMTVNDATPNVDGVDLETRLFVIKAPIGAISPITGLYPSDITSANQSVEITILFSQRWVADLIRIQSVVMAPGVLVRYTTSVTTNIDVECELDFCEVSDCISSTEAIIEATKSYEITKSKLLTEKMNKVTRLINIIQTLERCGKVEKIPDIIATLKKELELVGCSCGCGETDKPVYITGLGATAANPYELPEFNNNGTQYFLSELDGVMSWQEINIDLSGYALTGANISSFTNDAGYVPAGAGLSEFVNDAGFAVGGAGDYQDLGTVTANQTIDFALGKKVFLTLGNSDINLAFDNVVAGESYEVVIRNNGTGGRDVTVSETFIDAIYIPKGESYGMSLLAITISGITYLQKAGEVGPFLGVFDWGNMNSSTSILVNFSTDPQFITAVLNTADLSISAGSTVTIFSGKEYTFAIRNTSGAPRTVTFSSFAFRDHELQSVVRVIQDGDIAVFRFIGSSGSLLPFNAMILVSESTDKLSGLHEDLASVSGVTSVSLAGKSSVKVPVVSATASITLTDAIAGATYRVIVPNVGGAGTTVTMPNIALLNADIVIPVGQTLGLTLQRDLNSSNLWVVGYHIG